MITANRVIACSHRRASPDTPRITRREAPARCPDLAVFPLDGLAEDRTFEPVVLALESVAPAVKISRLGLAAIGFIAPRDTSEVSRVLHGLSRAVTDLATSAPTC